MVEWAIMVDPCWVMSILTRNIPPRFLVNLAVCETRLGIGCGMALSAAAASIEADQASSSNPPGQMKAATNKAAIRLHDRYHSKLEDCSVALRLPASCVHKLETCLPDRVVIDAGAVGAAGSTCVLCLLLAFFLWLACWGIMTLPKSQT